MALTLSDINTVKEKARGEARTPGVSEALRALWQNMQQLKNPDLKIAFLSGMETSDVVVSDSACKVYFIFAKKPAGSSVGSWLKGSDHATAAAADGDIVHKFVSTDNNEHVVFCDPSGSSLATGLTIGAHTTVNGNSKSLVADAPTGFAIVGAA